MRWLAYLLVAGGCFSKPAKVELSGDGGMDGSTDGLPEACFGQDGFTVCVPEAMLPTTPLSLPGGVTLINTDTCSDGETTGIIINPADNNPKLCVFLGTSITVTSTVSARGNPPFILIATTGEIVIEPAGLIDIATHRGPMITKGAGANFNGCAPATPAGESAGGAGGSFGGLGGKGGDAIGGGAAPGVETTAPFIRGGCAGVVGGATGAGVGGNPGASGGAVYLMATTSLTISGKINASGESGRGGRKTNGGGGGGGSGGLIALFAPTITVTGELWANGGGGGAGGDDNPGEDGGESTGPAVQAAGGVGSAGSSGGTGAIDGQDGGPGVPVAGGRGAGGGGGGLGVIKIVGGTLMPGGTFSPAPS
jgi:hypothetical protein